MKCTDGLPILAVRFFVKGIKPTITRYCVLALSEIQNDKIILVFVTSGVSLSTRQGWCTQNLAVCPNYCKDNGTSGATVNTCDPDACTYQCVCSDGRSPDPKRNCSATLKKTYTYVLPSSTPGPVPTPASTSGYHSSPSSLLTPNLANKSTPAIAIGFLIVFLTSITNLKEMVTLLDKMDKTAQYDGPKTPNSNFKVQTGIFKTP
ncbi:9262_t:CDS:2 [Cetraspora pellucida]|uniref:9262_t:CDS:1 n=1 Tax=Cetraspora pellucida TaxID=1433469 RepID=A0A9N9A3T0_9GLOM|nr:9262_t:CDS:2 [Cetraspora pellucida]